MKDTWNNPWCTPSSNGYVQSQGITMCTLFPSKITDDIIFKMEPVSPLKSLPDSINPIKFNKYFNVDYLEFQLEYLDYSNEWKKFNQNRYIIGGGFVQINFC